MRLIIPSLLKLQGRQQWRKLYLQHPEMLFCSPIKKEDTEMLANDGTDDHLGPHL